MIELKGKYNKDCKIFVDEIESEAISLIQAILDQPVSEGVPIRIQPDVHTGKSIVIGFTMPLTKYLNPLHIGTDIGCGMLSGKFFTEKALSKDNLKKIDNDIRKNVPMGFNEHQEIIFNEIPFAEVQNIADRFISAFNTKFNTSWIAPVYNEKWLTKKLKEINMDAKKFFNSIGTLGSGNHFIELGISGLDGAYWITIHSGSRNFGLKIAEYWVNTARKGNKNTNEYGAKLNDIVLNTKDKREIPAKIAELKKEFEIGVDREYLQDENLIGYLFDMIFAQQYAVWNRATMLDIIQDVIGIKRFEEKIETIHNYVDFNDFIVRKGAIASYAGRKMIIPWNMADGLVIAYGKSNADWNNSCAHGAGRLMSRSKAKETIDMEKFKRSMKDVYSTSVKKSTLDESPAAYKNAELIELLLEPTMEIIDRVRPLLNIKDCSEGESWKDRKLKKKVKAERAERRKFKEMFNR